MSAHDTDTTHAADGIYFVDEDDSRCVFLGLGKQVAHACGSHTHEHFHKLRSCDTVECRPRFTRHSFGKKRFTGSAGANEKYSFGSSCAERFIFRRIFQKVDHFLQFPFGFVNARYVGKRHLRQILVPNTRLTLTERKYILRAPASAHDDEIKCGDEENR